MFHNNAMFLFLTTRVNLSVIKYVQIFGRLKNKKSIY